MRGLPAYFVRLLKLCRKRGARLEDAWDIVQDAHLRLYVYHQSAIVRDADSLLRRIVLNLSINHFHRELSPGCTGRMPFLNAISVSPATHRWLQW
jgi:DNA-directed RNA polymerase specialized sigma24 family protein